METLREVWAVVVAVWHVLPFVFGAASLIVLAGWLAVLGAVVVDARGERESARAAERRAASVPLLVDVDQEQGQDHGDAAGAGRVFGPAAGGSGGGGGAGGRRRSVWGDAGAVRS